MATYYQPVNEIPQCFQMARKKVGKTCTEQTSRNPTAAVQPHVLPPSPTFSLLQPPIRPQEVFLPCVFAASNKYIFSNAQKDFHLACCHRIQMGHLSSVLQVGATTNCHVCLNSCLNMCLPLPSLSALLLNSPRNTSILPTSGSLDDFPLNFRGRDGSFWNLPCILLN